MKDCIYDFDETSSELPYLPMAARRALDACGLKLSLQSWRSLGVPQRWEIARAAPWIRLRDRRCPPPSAVPRVLTCSRSPVFSLSLVD